MTPLAGRRIAVTRPAAQAEALAQGIRELGGDPVRVPAIEIRDLEDAAPFDALAGRLAGFDLAVFVSRNAVRKALERLHAALHARPWPASLRVAAVGQGSREELLAQGFAGVIAPSGLSDSEALLALPELAQVRGWRIVIFRGDGGRQLLGEELGRRGAVVEYAACYRRVRPQGGEALRDLQAHGADAVTASSGEGLANLFEMLGVEAAGRLRDVPVFVPHARVARQASAYGLRRVIVAGPRDAEVLAALVAYFGTAR